MIIKRILLIGGAGYVGTKLSDELLKLEYEFQVVDTFWFGNFLNEVVNYTKLDAYNIDEGFLKNFEVVIFLGGMSNDPMAEFSPKLNFHGNLAVPCYLGYLAKRAGVRRFIFASSCSIYGFSPEKVLSELDVPLTNTPYGLSKLATERALMNLASTEFSVICLRKGTISGYSRRMRFDLLLNTMFAKGKSEGCISVNDPDIWRPMLGLSDAVASYLLAIQAQPEISGIFNISSGNYQVGELAEIVKLYFNQILNMDIRIEYRGLKDIRSYRVENTRARDILNFQPQATPTTILDELTENTFDMKNFQDDIFYNIRIFEKLNSGL